MALGEVADESLEASDESASEVAIGVVSRSKEKEDPSLPGRFRLISTSCPESPASTPPGLEALDKALGREIIADLPSRRLMPSMDLFSVGCAVVLHSFPFRMVFFLVISSAHLIFLSRDRVVRGRDCNF